MPGTTVLIWNAALVQVHNKRARIAKSENNNSKGLLVFPYNEKAARQDGTAKVGSWQEP